MSTNQVSLPNRLNIVRNPKCNAASWECHLTFNIAYANLSCIVFVDRDAEGGTNLEVLSSTPTIALVPSLESLEYTEGGHFYYSDRL